MLKIRRPLGRLIFNMGIAIPGKTVFLIETAPWSLALWRGTAGHRWIHKGPVTRTFDVSLFFTRTSRWINNLISGDLRRHGTYVTPLLCMSIFWYVLSPPCWNARLPLKRQCATVKIKKIKIIINRTTYALHLDKYSISVVDDVLSNDIFCLHY